MAGHCRSDGRRKEGKEFWYGFLLRPRAGRPLNVDPIQDWTKHYPIQGNNLTKFGFHASQRRRMKSAKNVVEEELRRRSLGIPLPYS